MTITINAAQADKLAQFARQWPDLLVVHQLPLAETNEADAMDLYVASAGEETRWRVSVDGRLIELKRADSNQATDLALAAAGSDHPRR